MVRRLCKDFLRYVLYKDQTSEDLTTLAKTDPVRRILPPTLLRLNKENGRKGIEKHAQARKEMAALELGNV